MTTEPVVLWLLGPTASGKTTIAAALAERLRRRGVPVVHFDGDEVRDWFGPHLGFAAEDRMRVVGTLVHLANKSREAGLNVVVSALTANRDARDHVNQAVGNLIVVYTKCSPETCAWRDPKGLYAKAERREIDTLIGFDGDYPPPERPDLVVDTERLTPQDALTLIMESCLADGRLADG